MEQATAALEAADWDAAREHFEVAVREDPSPDGLYGLGTALWWLGDTDGSVRAQERAYAEFRHRCDPLSAALTALTLCLVYGSSLGNLAAARGWMGRLARLVEDCDLSPMRGWLSLCKAVHANETADPTTAEVQATEALETARRTGDLDLELCALSELGFTLAQAGRIAAGSALMDEAMAGALSGEGRQLQTVVFAGCRSITACTRALEFGRALQWIRAAEGFTRRYGNLHLYTTCRTQYGSVLLYQGRWDEAERELRAALRIGRSAEPFVHGEALAKLAELRVAQGRLEEAEALLRGFEDHGAATVPRAQVHLRRGEPELAAALLHRALATLGQECVAAAPLCELTAEAEIAVGDVRAAVERAGRMAKAGERAGCQVMLACGSRALGRAGLASGDDAGAAGHLGRALEVFTSLEMPLDQARTHLLLARTRRQDAPAAAIAEARTALATFEGLGAAPDADEASAFLRALGVRPVRQGPRRTADGLTRREEEVLALVCEGLSNREIADRLFLTRKTVEHHVRSVLAKLGATNRTEAAAYAVRHLSADAAGSAGER